MRTKRESSQLLYSIYLNCFSKIFDQLDLMYEQSRIREMMLSSPQESNNQREKLERRREKPGTSYLGNLSNFHTCGAYRSGGSLRSIIEKGRSIEREEVVERGGPDVQKPIASSKVREGQLSDVRCHKFSGTLRQ